jgi:hypothetical protein
MERHFSTQRLSMTLAVLISPCVLLLMCLFKLNIESSELMWRETTGIWCCSSFPLARFGVVIWEGLWRSLTVNVNREDGMMCRLCNLRPVSHLRLSHKTEETRDNLWQGGRSQNLFWIMKDRSKQINKLYYIAHTSSCTIGILWNTTLEYGFHFRHRNPRTLPMESLAHVSGRTLVSAE